VDDLSNREPKLIGELIKEQWDSHFCSAAPNEFVAMYTNEVAERNFLHAGSVCGISRDSLFKKAQYWQDHASKRRHR
jgi:hypothetical protein